MEDVFYKDIYEKLYKIGYRVGVPCGRNFLKDLNRKFDFSSILDVGCSTGDLVASINRKGKERKAVGIDISPTAIKIAKRKGRKCEVGSITKIPFDDNSFDMVFSSDCVEHLLPKDLEISFREMLRVSSKYVAVQISTRKEKDTGKNNWVKKGNLKVENLHLSIFNFEEWTDIINKLDINIISSESEGKYVYFVMGK
jgi:ubiquinone/menaquinone biosynthesis C-methylase UbiE